MIISHRHKFIFVKTRKTASSSVELALSQFCGEPDVVTDLGPEDELLRKSLGATSPQNTLLPVSKYTVKDWYHFAVQGKRAHFRAHMPASVIRRLVGAEIWNGYFKFSVERNPWDRIISFYYWETREMDPRPSIYEFLTVLKPKHKPLSNFFMYTEDGKLIVDKIMRYECLEEDMGGVAKGLELGDTIRLPHAKAGIRADRRHYRDVLTAAERELIDTICADEIAFHKYEY